MHDALIMPTVIEPRMKPAHSNVRGSLLPALLFLVALSNVRQAASVQTSHRLSSRVHHRHSTSGPAVEIPVIADAEAVAKLESRRPSWAMSEASEGSESSSASAIAAAAAAALCPGCSLKATPPVASISVQAQADLKHDWGDRVEVEADLKPEPKPANVTKPQKPFKVSDLSDQQLLDMLARVRRQRIIKLNKGTQKLQELMANNYAKMRASDEKKLAVRRKRKQQKMERKVRALTRKAASQPVLRKQLAKVGAESSVSSSGRSSEESSWSSEESSQGSAITSSRLVSLFGAEFSTESGSSSSDDADSRWSSSSEDGGSSSDESTGSSSESASEESSDDDMD